MTETRQEWRHRSCILLLALVSIVGFLLLGMPKDVHAAKTGFVTQGKNTYYVDADGSRHKGFLTLDGAKYYFDPKTTYMLKGWQYNSKGEKIRYFNRTTGKMLEGYARTAQGQVRYFRKGNGLLMHGYATNSAGKVQYFQEGEGFRQTGWLQMDGQLRYFDVKTGYMKTGWVNSGTKKRYFQPERPEKGLGDYGALCSGLMRINGYYYYFTPAKTLNDIRKGGGVMVNSGFTEVNGRMYYFQSNGRAKVGWLTLDGKKYYFNAKGQMYRNTQQVVSGKTYTFNSSGVATHVPVTSNGDGTLSYTEYGIKMTLYSAYTEIPGIANGSVSDETVLAAIADREAGNQGVYGMMGVCMVVLNRTLDKNTSFPSDFRKVIFQKGQFNETSDGSFEYFEKRIKGTGWHSEAAARKAAKQALNMFNRYKLSGTARKINGYKSKDFDYLFFMTPASFTACGINANKVKWEQYKDHVFFDKWL